MTPVPRPAMRLGVPPGRTAWREALNTDSVFYGGSNLGNGPLALPVQPVASHGRDQSIELTLPPLAALYLVPA
jgi:1,4-alpha-glucan branching enzyme